MNAGVPLSGIYQCVKVSKGAKIRNGYNQVPCLTQDINGKVINSQLDKFTQNCVEPKALYVKFVSN